jgi:hypothetical protein
MQDPSALAYGVGQAKEARGLAAIAYRATVNRLLRVGIISLAAVGAAVV